MTTIPNMNLVIQQGDAAREIQHIRNQALETVQAAALERIESDDMKRTVIQPPTESDKATLSKDKQETDKKNSGRRSRRKKGAVSENLVLDPDKPGKLIDTVA